MRPNGEGVRSGVDDHDRILHVELQEGVLSGVRGLASGKSVGSRKRSSLRHVAKPRAWMNVGHGTKGWSRTLATGGSELSVIQTKYSVDSLEV
jgi:hypothetical protein